MFASACCPSDITVIAEAIVSVFSSSDGSSSSGTTFISGVNEGEDVDVDDPNRLPNIDILVCVEIFVLFLYVHFSNIDQSFSERSVHFFLQSYVRHSRHFLQMPYWNVSRSDRDQL